MRYVEKAFNISHEYFFVFNIANQRYVVTSPVTAPKQTLKGTSFNVQNFDCCKNVLAFNRKKLQSNFFNAIIIGKENSSRLSHVVLNNMFIDNYN